MDARELAEWNPSQDSLWDSSPNAVSLAFHPLPSGAYCVSRTTVLARKPSGRGTIGAYTQCLIVPPKTLARFANNPFALLQAVKAAGALRVDGRIPDQLEAIRVTGGTAAIDTGLLAKVCEDPGPQWMSALVQAALDSVTLAIVGGPPVEQVIAGLLNCLPPECRTEFSFSTGQEFSPRRPFRIVALSTEREDFHRVESLYNVATLRLSGDPPEEFAPVESWPRLVHRVLKSGQLSFLASQISKRPLPFDTEDLSAFGLRSLEALDGARFEATAPGDADRGRLDGPDIADEHPLGIGCGEDPASVPSCTPRSQPSKRNPSPRLQTTEAHAAHRRFSPAVEATRPQAGISIAPSRELKPAEPGMLAKLEELDVLVFDAVAGKSEALTRLRELWPKVRSALDRRLLSESLEQYVRYALELWLRTPGSESDAGPSRAVQSLDVLAVLFE
jgi:hypothetical protein